MDKTGAMSTYKIDLTRVVAQIPLRLRAAVKPHIARLQHALKLPKEDLCLDRRTLRRLQNDPGRLKFQEAMKTRARRQYRVEWRDGEVTICTLDEAAKTVKRKAASLRVTLSRSGGKWEGVVDDRLVIITRCASDDRSLK